MVPGRWLKVSQMDGPRPSSVTAPSIWYAAVADPQMKFGGRLDRSSTGRFSSGCSREDRVYLTAPAVRPATKYRCSARKPATTGMLTTRDAAITWFQYTWNC